MALIVPNNLVQFIDISNVLEEEINYIIKNCFEIRKINYKNPKAIELINKIKSLS